MDKQHEASERVLDEALKEVATDTRPPDLSMRILDEAVRRGHDVDAAPHADLDEGLAAFTGGKNKSRGGTLILVGSLLALVTAGLVFGSEYLVQPSLPDVESKSNQIDQATPTLDSDDQDDGEEAGILEAPDPSKPALLTYAVDNNTQSSFLVYDATQTTSRAALRNEISALIGNGTVLKSSFAQVGDIRNWVRSGENTIAYRVSDPVSQQEAKRGPDLRKLKKVSLPETKDIQTRMPDRNIIWTNKKKKPESGVTPPTPKDPHQGTNVLTPTGNDPKWAEKDSANLAVPQAKGVIAPLEERTLPSVTVSELLELSSLDWLNSQGTPIPYPTDAVIYSKDPSSTFKAFDKNSDKFVDLVELPMTDFFAAHDKDKDAKLTKVEFIGGCKKTQVIVDPYEYSKPKMPIVRRIPGTKRVEGGATKAELDKIVSDLEEAIKLAQERLKTVKARDSIAGPLRDSKNLSAEARKELARQAEFKKSAAKLETEEAARADAEAKKLRAIQEARSKAAVEAERVRAETLAAKNKANAERKAADTRRAAALLKAEQDYQRELDRIAKEKAAAKKRAIEKKKAEKRRR